MAGNLSFSSDGPSRGRGQLRRGRIPNFTKTSFGVIHVHVALCGLEHRQTTTTTRVLIRPPAELVHGHTLPIMLTQMIIIVVIRVFVKRQIFRMFKSGWHFKSGRYGQV